MPIQKGLVYAIIPARSGSTSIKDKNIRLIAGHPLMSYSIVAAKLCNNIDRVIMTTDSEKYAAIANQYGAETPFLRPEEISGKYSTDLEFMLHAINWFEEHEHILPEYWVHLRPTSPLRDPKIIENAIEMIKKEPTADSLRSVHKTNNCPFKWFTIDTDGHLHTICNITLDEANGPRQQYPQVYIPNGYVDVLKTEYIINNKLLHGTTALSYITEELVDIDYNEELEEILRIITEKTNPVLTQLNIMGASQCI